MRSKKQVIGGESGRSMVEMLGVLAIMGVLAIGGIAGYRWAMDKYNANEILNEVRKRAVTASQQRILNQPIDLSEYGDNTIQGHTVTTADNYNRDSNFFTIRVAGIEKDICDKVLAEKIPFVVEEKVGEVVVDEDTTCSKVTNDITFVFANDLDNKAVPEPRCALCSIETTCSNGLCLCPTGQEVCGTICCSAEQMCSGKSVGACVSADGCIQNSECQMDEYCKIEVIQDGSVNSCYKNYVGTCTPLGEIYGPIIIDGLRTIIASRRTMNWWSARNWCQANKKQLMSENTLGCDRFVGEFGFCCKDKSNCSEDIEQQGDVLQILRVKYQANDLPNYVWINKDMSTCNAFRLSLTDGQISTYYQSRYLNYHALCE